MEAKVTLSHEKVESVVEVQVHSGGEWYEAKEVAEDMYAAIDTHGCQARTADHQGARGLQLPPSQGGRSAAHGRGTGCGGKRRPIEGARLTLE